MYSNFDHQLDEDVRRQLEAAPEFACAQHAAWDFCGYVWQLHDGRWVEQVWVHHAVQEEIYADGLGLLIATVNGAYGGQ